MFSLSFPGSVEMLGNPDLQPECDVRQLEPLLPEQVVNDLLGKYLKTFTVSPLFSIKYCLFVLKVKYIYIRFWFKH